MTTTDARFSGSIPVLYDRHLGRLLFEAYARDLAERAASVQARAVLETAAGTGIVTRALTQKLPGAHITATDLNQPMLDHAAAQLPASHLTWRQADAQELPFPDGAFDCVVCQFGVMFFPEKPKGYAEAHRVLRPGGRFVFNVWDRIESNAVSHAIEEALAQRYPRDPPRFLSRAPYGYHDVGAIRGALSAAGFTAVESFTVAERSRGPSAMDAAIGLCQGTPLRAEIEARAPGDLEAATTAAATWLERRHGAGALDAPMQAHVFVARKA